MKIKVGVIVYYDCTVFGRKFCKVAEIEPSKNFNKQKIKGYWSTSLNDAIINFGNAQNWMFNNEVTLAQGYQTPLWKVLNGEDV